VPSRGRVSALLVGAAAISTLAACGRMAVKYGGPPAPPEDVDAPVEAPAEPESLEEPSEAEEAEEAEAPSEPEDPEAG
jgi:hypothetical protein